MFLKREELDFVAQITKMMSARHEKYYLHMKSVRGGANLHELLDMLQ